MIQKIYITKKKNIIYNNINDILINKNSSIHKLKIIYSYLKNLFYLKNYIYKFINIPFKKYNINKFKNNINKVIYYKNLLDNNLENSLNNNHKNNKNNITLIQKKINNISNIIDKNNILLLNLKSNIENTSDKQEKYYLNILHNNLKNNEKMFGGKLKKYFIELNNTTKNIDKKINNNNINSVKYKELLDFIEKINSNSYKKQISNFIKLFISLLFNKKLIKLNKIKNLLKKYNTLSY